MTSGRHWIMTAVLASAALVPAHSAARGRSEPTYAFVIEAPDLGDALRQVAAKAGLELYADAREVNGVRAPRVEGVLTAREAIARLLAGTMLQARFRDGAVIIRARSASHDDTDPAESGIVVTGSRIEGAPPSAPLTVVRAEDIRNAGQADLGEVARALPQNFGGGQNPGIGSAQGAPNQNSNVNGASTFNLRGIGPNATLTLLNGNRLSYSGISAAIDISAIPVTAVDRVEISADGASAIYGADAVAGVVNVILKKDYSGLSVTGRVGGSTDGGNVQQQYDVVTGSTWTGGGVLVAYDFFSNSAIRAGDRGYARAANPASTLYPDIERHSLLITAHQNVREGLRLSTDFILKTGEMNSANGYLTNRPVDFQGIRVRRKFDTLGIAPTLDLQLAGAWTARLSGFYGTDRTDGVSRVYSAGTLASTPISRFLNSSHAIEASAQGPLFSLPGGDARLALGGGFRAYHFTNDVPGLYRSRRRHNYFAFAEAFLPLIGPAQDIPLLRTLSLTGAARVEDYSGASRIVTPKAGIMYEPVRGLEIKGSWGRSFKLPTLYQQYAGYAAILFPVSGYGASFPPGSTFIYTLGSNADTKAERSENWSLSAEAKPLDGLSLSASYFHILYTDRVAPPLASTAGALTNPLYASLVTFNPSLAQQQAAAAGASAPAGLQNGTGGRYDPATVIAILDARDRNIARQWYQGVDLAARYRLALSADQAVTLSAAGTWLKSRQRLLPGAPTTPLAGQIFNPPHWKARGGASWSNARASVSAFLSYTGGVVDARRALKVDVDAFTTLDLTGRYRLGGFEIGLNVLNLFNAKPAPIATGSTSDTPFDTTNYSAVGRFLSVSLGRAW